MTKFKLPMCALHKTSQFYLTVLHKYTTCYVMWNGEKNNIDKIKFFCDILK